MWEAALRDLRQGCLQDGVYLGRIPGLVVGIAQFALPEGRW
jgi:hypothetical protein